MKIKIILIIYLYTLSASSFADLWGASNFYECLLDRLPDVKNDPAAIEIRRSCKRDFPNSPVYIEKRKSFFGVKTAGECVTEYAKDVTSPKGAKWIRYSCYKLYNKY